MIDLGERPRTASHRRRPASQVAHEDLEERSCHRTTIMALRIGSMSLLQMTFEYGSTLQRIGPRCWADFIPTERIRRGFIDEMTLLSPRTPKSAQITIMACALKFLGCMDFRSQVAM